MSRPEKGNEMVQRSLGVVLILLLSAAGGRAAERILPPGASASSVFGALGGCPQQPSQSLVPTDSFDLVLLPAIPGATPKPMPLFPWLCGACSQEECLDLYNGAPCEIGAYVGTCYISAPCSPPPFHYCGCY